MATQKAFASYQEIVDLHTESDQVTAIGIHTPQGDTPRKMFGGFFDQFKKYKYVGASVTLVPAARLPVDPLGVSYEAGEPTIDPRDMLNPILFHGCHGNDMGSILNKLYGNPDYGNASDSMDVLESHETTQIPGSVGTMQRLYYQALTDTTWRKAHPQKGFRKSGLRPLVYSLASTRQIMPGSSITGIGVGQNDLMGVNVSGDFDIAGDQYGGDFNDNDEWVSTQTRLTPQFITPRLTSLGWIDTRNVLHGTAIVEDPIESSEIGSMSFQTQIAQVLQNDAYLPKIYMGIILLPPAYKTEQYFRMIINHHFAFKNFRGCSMDNSQVGFGSLPQNVTNAYEGYQDNGGGGSDPTPGPSPAETCDVTVVVANTISNFTLSGLSINIDGSPAISNQSIESGHYTGPTLNNVPVGSVISLTSTDRELSTLSETGHPIEYTVTGDATIRSETVSLFSGGVRMTQFTEV